MTKRFLVLLLLMLSLTSCSQDIKNAVKDIQSSTGNLRRTITVYSYDGKAIKSWDVNTDIQNYDDHAVFFDPRGGRVTVRGGILISEED